ncbi:MAG TPA: hypothetical protein VGM08_00230 [Candidatus Saccharimonadales bacterium]|jgi:hypothetical protein
MQRLKRLRVGLLPHRLVLAQTLVLLVCAFVIFEAQASAVIRFNDRSLYINSSVPGATTSYKISFTYNNQAVPTTTVGSIDLLFCYDPIPSEPITSFNPVDHHPCVAPAGLDVSHAVLSDQTGETGFSILSESSNHIVLTRTPGAVSETPSTYTFSGIQNPTDTTHSFAIRMSDYPTTDATGQLINLGSVISQVASSIEIDTQVPPFLTFCVAGQVSSNCAQELGGNATDFGDLFPETTAAATSQMAVATNARSGFVVTANGPTIEAGTHVIPAMTTQTISAPGNDQFGINLVANNDPLTGPIGSNIDNNPGTPTAFIMPNYDTPNEYMYQDGDTVAEGTGVNLGTIFTVTYVINNSPDLHPGVYSTTITYICSGRF